MAARSSAHPTARPPAVRSLVGRHRARATLAHAVDDAVAGRGGLLLLTGDPGIGKTALASAAAEHATSRGALVAWGTCWDGDGAPSLWPWTQVLRALGGVPPLLGDTVLDERAAPFRLFDAVTQELLRVAGSRPLLLVLDDLHWADASSVRLLAFLARQCRTAPLLVIGSYRDVDVAARTHPLHDLLPPVVEQARVLPVRGLEPEDVELLVEQLLGSPVTTAFATELHDRTGGNPFFVEQLALLPTGEGAGRPALPPSVGDVVARRLARLPRATLGLLEAAAVLGTRFDLGTAAAVAGLDPGAAVAAVEQAARARVVSTSEAQTRFAHDLFREVLSASLPAERRRRLHLAVAEELAEQAASGRAVPLQEVAHHRAAALPLGDRARARDALLAAARDAARRSAFDEAADLYRRALEAGGATPGLLVEHAHALRCSGQPAAAYERFLAAADRARAEDDRSALTAAALGAHLVTTRTGVPHSAALALLEEALEQVTQAPVERCLVLAALARELCDGPARDVPRADALAKEAVREARAFGEGSVLAHALWAQLDVAWRPGTAARRLPLTLELEAVAQEADEQELQLEARFTRLVARLELADPAWSPELDEFSRRAGELRLPHYRYLALSRRASRACLTGPLDVADALVEEAARYGEQFGEPDAWDVRASQWVGLALLRGDWARISARAAAVDRPLVPPPYDRLLQAHLHLSRGEVGAAAGLVAGLRDLPDIGYRWRRTAALAMLAELATAVADRTLCDRLYAELLPEARTIGVLGGAVFTTGPVAHQLGLLAGAAGRADEAVAHLEDAVALAERIAAGLFAARCRSGLAEALLVRGRAEDRRRAGELLAEVARTAGPLGLTALAERARTRLQERATNVFRREDDVWTLAYAGRTARLRDAKGLHDLARLLAAPGREIAATDLLGLDPGQVLGADDVLDDQARTALRRRVVELDEQLDAADAAGDAERGAALTGEREALVRELHTASGLAGRRRRLGDLGERARSTVTARIRDSIRHVDQVHPELGRHLHASVTTGARCSYSPADTVRWTT